MANTGNGVKQVFDALAVEARKNGKISEEELEILQQVKYDLHQYNNALKLALEDGVITDAENERLDYLRDQIEINAMTVANFDGIIDEEEQGLMGVLAKVIDQYLR